MNPTPTPFDMWSDSTEDLLRTDAHNREQAIDPKRSFIVEAPAGAGKTELLTQRFLALLAKVNDPEEIVALTFTNKAAAEMRHRIISSLQMAASGQEPPEGHKKTTFGLGAKVLKHDAERRWDLLMNGGRLQITTLDALCGKLARQMPLLSRMGSQPVVTTDADAFYADAALQTLEGVEAAGPEAEAIARVLSYFDNDAGKFQALLVAMLASRDQWLRHSRAGVELASAEQAMKELVALELADVAAAMPLGWQPALMPWARFAGSQVALARSSGEEVPPELEAVALLESWTETLKPEADALPMWRGLCQLLCNKSGGIRSQLPAVLGFGSTEGKPLIKPFKAFLDSLKLSTADETLARIRKLPSPHYNGQEQQLIADLLTVLRVAGAHLWLGFKQAGEVDFTEIAQRALLALGHDDDPSELALKLDYQLSHLLVDEFQDTSPTQVELLKRLTAGWTRDSGRTLFLVGDPMQSIYKFRKADVGLFLKVRDKGLGDLPLQPLALYRNNRSSADVVEWVNRVFPQVFSEENNHHRGAVKFAKAQATKPAHADSRVTWHPVLDEQADTDDEDTPLTTVAEHEAQAVVDIVLQTQRTQPEAKVAILVRARTHLQALVQLLRTRYPALKYQAIEIEGLASRQVIQDLLSLTHALLHQGDRTHWLAVLRAPWCGLLLQDLHQLVAHDHRASVWDLVNDNSRIALLTDDGQERLLRVRQVLRLAFEHQGRQRLRRWLEGVWQALGGPCCLTGPSDLVDAHAFLDVVDKMDSAGSFDLSRLAQEMDQLYAAPDPLAPDRLQIMTIHKSKGLEFDTVIVPGLHKKAPRTDKKLLLWDEVMGADDQEKLVVASIPYGRHAATDEPNKFDFLHLYESERGKNETQRLLYVAVTRAKQNLHLVGCAKPDAQADGGVKAPVKDSFLSLLWHDAAAHYAEAAQALVNNTEDPERTGVRVEPARLYNHRLVRLGPQYQPWVLPVQTPAPEGTAVNMTTEEIAASKPLGSDDEPRASGSRFLADVGTLVHRYLQLVAEDGLDKWSVQRVRDMHRPMVQWFVSQGHAAQEADAGAQEVTTHLVATLESDKGCWVLAAHEEAVCEKSYTTVRDGVMQTHVIDRMFKSDGVRWIVDYKTTAHVPEREADLHQHMKDQIHRYAGLFAEEEKLSLAIYFTKTAALWVCDK